MFQLFRNRYFIFFVIAYMVCASVLIGLFNQPFTDLLEVLIAFGILLPLVAWILVKNAEPLIADKHIFKGEGLILGGLIFFFTWYVTYGSAIINKIIPVAVMEVAWKNSLAIFLKKLLVFVVVPFIVYNAFGFSFKDFGFAVKKKDLFGKQSILSFVILSTLILVFQYFFSGGAKLYRDRVFNTGQLAIGLPLLFIWLFIEVGLIEEFFFRAVLQSRLSVLFRAPVAGIVISGLIFGLAHAPGLYLRGAESEGISEQLPFGFWAAYTVTAMSLAGIFLGIIWQKTKNIYLVMALHTMVDLLPNTAEFFKTWNI